MDTINGPLIEIHFPSKSIDDPICLPIAAITKVSWVDVPEMTVSHGFTLHVGDVKYMLRCTDARRIKEWANVIQNFKIMHRELRQTGGPWCSECVESVCQSESSQSSSSSYLQSCAQFVDCKKSSKGLLHYRLRRLPSSESSSPHTSSGVDIQLESRSTSDERSGKGTMSVSPNAHTAIVSSEKPKRLSDLLFNQTYAQALEQAKSEKALAEIARNELERTVIDAKEQMTTMAAKYQERIDDMRLHMDEQVASILAQAAEYLERYQQAKIIIDQQREIIRNLITKDPLPSKWSAIPMPGSLESDAASIVYGKSDTSDGTPMTSVNQALCGAISRSILDKGVRKQCPDISSSLKVVAPARTFKEEESYNEDKTLAYNKASVPAANTNRCVSDEVPDLLCTAPSAPPAPLQVYADQPVEMCDFNENCVLGSSATASGAGSSTTLTKVTKTSASTTRDVLICRPRIDTSIILSVFSWYHGRFA